MKLRYSLLYMCFVALIVFAMAQNTIAGPAKFAVIDLGNFGLFTSRAQGINQFGHITGFSTTPNNLFHAMLWRDGILSKLIDDNTRSEGIDINDSDQVVGWAEFDTVFPGRAMLWDNGTLFDLGTLGGTFSNANAINTQGQIVGWADVQNDPFIRYAFIWENGVMKKLINPSCNQCNTGAEDINNLGQSVGFFWRDFDRHAATWDASGNMTELPERGTITIAHGINDLGQIVGESNGGAALWENGQISIIGESSIAHKINNNGLIVGADAKGRNHGAIWDTKGNERNLNNLVAPFPKLWVDNAFDINDKNQIAARAIPNQGNKFKFFAVVLTPVNPVFELVEPVPGVAGALNTIVARGGNLQPGSVVSFYWGVQGGGTLMPNCNMLDAVLQIENAKFAGSAVVDDNGVATLEGMVPSGAKGLNILFQAVTGPGSPSGCGQSQLVVVKFQ